MLVTESQLKQIIKKVLLEDKKPKQDTKMFDGKSYSSKAEDGNKSMTLMYDDGYNAYFLLTKGKKNKDPKFKVIKPTGKYQKELAWTSDLDEYSDYTSRKFYEHAKEERIVYTPRGLSDVKEEIVTKGVSASEIADLAYDTIVDGGAAVAGIFPATMTAASGVHMTQAVKKLAQGKFVDSAISALSAIPLTSSGVATLGSLAKNPATRQGLAQVIKNTPGMAKGLQDFLNSINNNESEITEKFKEVTSRAKKPASFAGKMYTAIKDLLEKINKEI